MDSGVNVQLEEGMSFTPTSDVDDGLVAYVVEAATQDLPHGSKIVIRRLSDGGLVREIQSSTAFGTWRSTLATSSISKSRHLT